MLVWAQDSCVTYYTHDLPSRDSAHHLFTKSKPELALALSGLNMAVTTKYLHRQLDDKAQQHILQRKDLFL